MRVGSGARLHDVCCHRTHHAARAEKKVIWLRWRGSHDLHGNFASCTDLGRDSTDGCYLVIRRVVQSMIYCTHEQREGLVQNRADAGDILWMSSGSRCSRIRDRLSTTSCTSWLFMHRSQLIGGASSVWQCRGRFRANCRLGARGSDKLARTLA